MAGKLRTRFFEHLKAGFFILLRPLQSSGIWRPDRLQWRLLDSCFAPLLLFESVPKNRLPSERDIKAP